MASKTIIIDPKSLAQPDSSLSPIPQDIVVKEGFQERYKQLLGDKYDEFMRYSTSYIRKSIRVNTLKISVKELQKRLEKDWELVSVPWCSEGFYIRFKKGDRFDIGNLPEHQLGYIYVQDAASMIPPLVLDPKPGDVILDLCSAPGSKTTQMAAMMENDGLIVANDISGSRLKPLGLNLQRCGIRNTVVTLRANNKLKQEFDRILVDAPCSATGTIRRSLKTLQMWSPNSVQSVCQEQRAVLKQAWRILKPGGVLVYSTCTLEPEEDEGMISWFLEKNEDAELLDIDLPGLKRSEPVTEFDGLEYNPDVKKCIRIYPQDNDTEGFFISLLRKKE